MAILSPNCFTEIYLRQIQEATKAQDLVMLERCVIALELVGRLKQHGLNFTFKGGTSLLLHLPEPKRLSIDVDIICQEADKLPEVLDNVVREAPFTRWEPQPHRDRDEPPTKHALVFYNSSVAPPDFGAFIVIDVIETDTPHARLIEKELNTNFIEPVESVSITLPSVSSMLGDKLAAFAPGTIGYPYEPLTRKGDPDTPRPANVVKHLFDVGQLAALADNLEEAITSYQNIHAEQCQWRGAHTLDACLDDTQAAAVLASQVEALNQASGDKDVDFFRQGVNSVASHMFAERFGRAALRIASARATLVAEVVRRNRKDFNLVEALTARPDIALLRGARLTDNWAVIDRLKRSDIGAYVLWEHAQRLRNG